MGRPENWGSHLPTLVQAVERTVGPVLELGAGFFSTPVLHALCRSRLLVTMESDKAWLDNFRHMECGRHRFVAVENTLDGWLAAVNKVIVEVPDIAVAFVDHQPSETRVECAARLAPFAKVLLLHDQPPRRRRSEVDRLHPVLTAMPYRKVFVMRGVLTTAFSNSIDLSQWDDL